KVPIVIDTGKAHDEIVKRVRKILAAKRTAPDTDMSAIEYEIDQLVYQLYGLTEEEIRIVEGEG
ncbi:MAG: restriction endonuclease, partial [Thaumarchaeota archaeon]|nr:restriction endonuclease [Nitrososphaerota archaeon]